MRTEVSDATAALLVERAARGDPAAWDALVEAYGGLVWSVARREVRSARDAADVSQTTWLRLVEHIDRLSNPTRVGAWLATTARREARRVAARGRRLVPTDDTRLQAQLDADRAVTPDRGAEVDYDLLRTESSHALKSAMERLGEREQRLLRMLMHEPALPYTTISCALGMPIGSIGPTRARCLSKLRNLLAENA